MASSAAAAAAGSGTRRSRSKSPVPAAAAATGRRARTPEPDADCVACGARTCHHTKDDKAKFAANLAEWNKRCEKNGWVCPISLEPLDDSAILASDGHMYNRSSFEKAVIATGVKSPVTRTPFQSDVYFHADYMRRLRDAVIGGYACTYYERDPDTWAPFCTTTKELMKNPTVLFPRGSGKLQQFVECSETSTWYESTALVDLLKHSWCRFSPTSVLGNFKIGAVESKGHATKLFVDLNQSHVGVPVRLFTNGAASFTNLPLRFDVPAFDGSKLSGGFDGKELNYSPHDDTREHTNMWYTNCTFKRNDPKDHTFKNCKLIDCVFYVDCWCSTRFEACSFVRCTWHTYEKENLLPLHFCDVKDATVTSTNEGVYHRTQPFDAAARQREILSKLRGVDYEIVQPRATGATAAGAVAAAAVAKN